MMQDKHGHRQVVPAPLRSARPGVLPLWPTSGPVVISTTWTPPSDQGPIATLRLLEPRIVISGRSRRTGAARYY
eukprot:618726-Hanusia_phi.AAC.1